MRYKSVFQNHFTQNDCFLCGRPAVQWHHIFNGAYKKKSEKYGAMVRLCFDCHLGSKNGVHNNQDRWNYLRQEAQKRIMQENNLTVDEWRSIFEKNHL